jgi:hypothetical protein
MNEQLRPLTLAEILDRTAQMYRSRFLVFLGISVIPAATVFVFVAAIFGFFAWVGGNSRHGGSVSDVLIWLFIGILSILIVPVGLGISAWGSAAISEASARMFLGDSTTIRNAYKNTWKRGWRYVGLYILQGLLIVGIPGVAFSIGMFAMIAGKVSGYAAGDNSPLFGGLMFLMFLVLGAFALWMLLRLCLAFPVCVVEQASATNALRRGVALSEGTRGRIFVLYLLGLVLNWVLTWGFTFVVLIAVALIPALQGQKHSQAVGMIILIAMYGSYFAVKALTKPVYGIALTIFYFDQRIRKEGFDIEWMMQQAGMVVAPQPTPVPQAAAEPEVTVEPVATPEPEHAAALVAESQTEIDEALTTHEQGMAAAVEEGKA